MARTKKLKLVDRYFIDLNQQAECEELEQQVRETAVKRFRFEQQTALAEAHKVVDSYVQLFKD